MNLEWKAWEEGAPTVNPMWMWLPQLQTMIMRLRGFVSELGGCGEGSHQEPGAVKRDYDEELWEKTVFTRVEAKTLDRPTQTGEATFVRVRVVDDNGELVGESNLGGAGVRRKARGESTAVMELVWERADS